MPHSFETSPELPPPGPFHTPAGRDGHRPPDNVGAAGKRRNFPHRDKMVVQEKSSNIKKKKKINFPSGYVNLTRSIK